MRWTRWVAIAIAAGALGAAPAKQKPAAETVQAKPAPAEAAPSDAALTRDEASALAVWVDDDVSVEGKGAKWFDDGSVETVRGRVSGALMQLGMKVVKTSKTKHDVVAKIGLVELERRSGLFTDSDTGTLSLELEADGRLLAETRRRFGTRDAIDAEIGAAVEELGQAPGLVAFARERARSRSPVAVAAAAQEAGPKGVKRVAVLEFRGPLGPAVLSGVADEARGAVAESLRAKGVAVMTRESMAVVLKDMGKDIAACGEGECEVETGRMIGADLVVTGEVIQVEKVYVLILKLHETAGGSLVATKQARGKDALEIMDAVKPAAVALFR
jgi:hypothetical protein